MNDSTWTRALLFWAGAFVAGVCLAGLVLSAGGLQ